MAKSTTCKLQHADPKYPYRSRINEEGVIVYSVPLLAPEDTTLKEPVLEASEMTHTEITVFGGRPLRVHFVETTDKEWAYRQNSYLNTYHTEEERYASRYQLLKTRDDTAAGDCIWDRFSTNQGTEDGFTVADFSDLPDRVAAYIDKQYPENDLYSKVYRLFVIGYEAKEVEKELGLGEGMAYFYKNKAYDAAKEYRKKYYDEGQYTFPQDKPRKKAGARKNNISYKLDGQNKEDKD